MTSGHDNEHDHLMQSLTAVARDLARHDGLQALTSSTNIASVSESLSTSSDKPVTENKITISYEVKIVATFAPLTFVQKANVLQALQNVDGQESRIRNVFDFGNMGFRKRAWGSKNAVIADGGYSERSDTEMHMLKYMLFHSMVDFAMKCKEMEPQEYYELLLEHKVHNSRGKQVIFAYRGAAAA